MRSMRGEGIREYGAEDVKQAFQDAVFVLTEVKKLLALGHGE